MRNHSIRNYTPCQEQICSLSQPNCKQIMNNPISDYYLVLHAATSICLGFDKPPVLTIPCIIDGRSMGRPSQRPRLLQRFRPFLFPSVHSHRYSGSLSPTRSDRQLTTIPSVIRNTPAPYLTQGGDSSMPTPLAFSDPKELDSKIEAYFSHCENTADTRQLKSGDIRIRKQQPTMIGLAVWLGCSKDTLYSWISGEHKANISEADSKAISALLSRTRDRIENSLLHAALEGDVDPKIAALVLYNYGYTNKTQEDATVTVRVQAAPGVDVAAWSK